VGRAGRYLVTNYALNFCLQVSIIDKCEPQSITLTKQRLIAPGSGQYVNIQYTNCLSIALHSNLTFRQFHPIIHYQICQQCLSIFIQLIMWLSMTFYCWECTKALDEGIAKMSSVFPVAIVMWSINLLITLACWFLSIKKR
jgi:hypothetical protein